MKFKIKEKVKKILIQSQKYTKTDMLYLVKNSSWLILAKIVGALLALLSSIIFANTLSPTTYGLYRYILTFIGILSITTLPGMNTAINKSIAEKKYNTYIPAFKTKICWGLAGSLFSIMIALYYLEKTNFHLFFIFLAIALTTPLIESLYLYQSKLNGEKKFKKIMFYVTFSRIFQTTVLITTVLITSNIVFIIFSYLLSILATRTLFFIKTTNKKIKIEKNNNINKTLHYGKHLSIMQAISLLSTYLDKILIFQFIGPIQLAAYYLALIPYKQTKNILSSINTIAFPKFSIQNKQTIQKTVITKIKKMYILIFPIIFIYILLAPLFFRTLYSQYPSAIIISQLIFLQLLFYPISILTTLFQAKAEKQKLYILSLSYALIRIILLCILIPLYEISGAIATILITRFIESAVALILFKKEN